MKESDWPCKIKHAFMFCIHEMTFMMNTYGLICAATTNFSSVIGFFFFFFKIYSEIGKIWFCVFMNSQWP